MGSGDDAGQHKTGEARPEYGLINAPANEWRQAHGRWDECEMKSSR